ncbi:MAG: nicotinate-nucleotide adenylyltransferase [Actinomycetales bacterium]
MRAMQRRIGVMGGTFDPIHHGHLVAASEVCHRFALDHMLFSPTGQPWHKDATPGAQAEDRYLMTVLATSADPRFDVTRVDIERVGPTYTRDTLRDLRAQTHQWAAISGEEIDWYFVTGADAIATIGSWQEPAAIVEQAHLVAVSRPGHSFVEPPLPAGSWSWAEIPALAISSTDIRNRVARGEPIDYLVPHAVAQFIAKRGLYCDQPGKGAA